MELFIPFSGNFSAQLIISSIVGFSPAYLLFIVSEILAKFPSSFNQSAKYFSELEDSNLCSPVIIWSFSTSCRCFVLNSGVRSPQILTSYCLPSVLWNPSFSNVAGLVHIATLPNSVKDCGSVCFSYWCEYRYDNFIV